MKNPLSKTNPLPHPLFFALKIKDGLFIGDSLSPNSPQFLSSNKITSIINCSPTDVSIATRLKLLNLKWGDEQPKSVRFDFNQPCRFIDDAHKKLQGVLVCELKGKCRTLTVVAAYFMKKYSWSVHKTLEYLHSKARDFDIKAEYLGQLIKYEEELFGGKMKTFTKNWNQTELEQDGEIVKNTFINSRLGNLDEPDFKREAASIEKKSVKFNDRPTVINFDKAAEVLEDTKLKRMTTPAKVKQPVKENTAQVHKVFENYLKEKSKDKPVRRIKTEADQKIDQFDLFTQQHKESFKQPVSRKDKALFAPYKAHNNINRQKELIAELKEDVMYNINLKIKNVNFIQYNHKQKRKPKIYTEKKLKIYGDFNPSKPQQLRRFYQPRHYRSSSLKKHSVDSEYTKNSRQQSPYHQPHNKSRFIQSLFH